jgi:hypothetical protein
MLPSDMFPLLLSPISMSRGRDGLSPAAWSIRLAPTSGEDPKWQLLPLIPSLKVHMSLSVAMWRGFTSRSDLTWPLSDFSVLSIGSIVKRAPVPKHVPDLKPLPSLSDEHRSASSSHAKLSADFCFFRARPA